MNVFVAMCYAGYVYSSQYSKKNDQHPVSVQRLVNRTPTPDLKPSNGRGLYGDG
jgi:hypothetical protein